jgi:hypothetical protein
MNKIINKRLHIAVLLLICNTATAQQHKQNAQGVQLHANNSANHAGNVASITVVGNLTDSTFLGIAPSMEPNTRTNLVVPAGGAQSWLQSFVQQQYAANFKNGGVNVKWVINNLSIGADADADSATRFSYTAINADVYTANGSLKFQYLGNFDTLMVSNDTNPDFGAGIAAAIDALYSNTVSTTNNLHPNNGNAPAAQSTPAVLLDSVHPAGIYTTFQEFLNNAPSVTHFMVGVDDNTRQVMLYQLAADTSKTPLPNAWGLSVGREIYRFQNGQLYAIEKEENGFALSKYLDYMTRKNQGNFWRRTIGRKQGDVNPFNDKHIFRVAAQTNGTTYYIETTHLNMNNGNITF